LLSPGVGEAVRRRIEQGEMRSRVEAVALVEKARGEAAGLLAQARAEAKALATEAAQLATAEAHAQAIAEWIAVRSAEQALLEKEHERIVEVGVALAERLLGAALDLAPARIAQLALSALQEARGARRAIIGANPRDAAPLREHLSIVGLDLATVEVREEEGLARGDLRLHTDLGTIDARLATRFDRLGAALRDALSRREASPQRHA
jgi:flagellar assembly protein FliH